jgi:hypothetical protein
MLSCVRLCVESKGIFLPVSAGGRARRVSPAVTAAFQATEACGQSDWGRKYMDKSTQIARRYNVVTTSVKSSLERTKSAGRDPPEGSATRASPSFRLGSRSQMELCSWN